MDHNPVVGDLAFEDCVRRNFQGSREARTVHYNRESVKDDITSNQELIEADQIGEGGGVVPIPKPALEPLKAKRWLDENKPVGAWIKELHNSSLVAVDLTEPNWFRVEGQALIPFDLAHKQVQPKRSEEQNAKQLAFTVAARLA